MAREKKKESALTPEEKLAQALIPDWEQPYKVPKNWCWVRFGQLAVDMADGPFGSNLKTEHYTQEKQARIIQLSNIGENGWREENTKYTTFEHAKTISRSIVEPGNIVIAKMMPAGRAIICPNAEAQYVLSSDAVKMIPHSQLNSKYLLFQINSHHFQLQVQENTQGITRARTSIKKLKEYAFAVAPLDEQQRIVDRIEYLFTRLDEAKEKAQSVLDSFETRKAAILHKAFTGELTAQWRAEHSVGMDTWKHHTFRELCTDIVRGGSPRPAGSPKFYDGPIPFMKVADITRNNSPYVSSAEYSIKEAGLKKTRMVSANTLLLTNSGATLGVPAICTFETTFNDGIAAFLGLPEDTLLFYYYFWTSKTSDLRAINKGAAQPNLNTTIIGDVEIDVPSDPEKYAIVRILDSLLAKEEQAKEAAESVLEKIDLLKKSILARAFRGELGTNNPTEESALELLKSTI